MKISKKTIIIISIIVIIVIIAIIVLTQKNNKTKELEQSKIDNEQLQETNVDTSNTSLNTAVQTETENLIEENGEVEEAEETEESAYTNLLNGDFSYFAGTWKDGNGYTIELSDNGTISFTSGGIYYSYILPELEDDGTYFIHGKNDSYDDMEKEIGFEVYPVGIETHLNLTTDTTKIRLKYQGNGMGISTENDFFYKQ